MSAPTVRYSVAFVRRRSHSAYVRAAIAWALSASNGHALGTSLIPLTYSSNSTSFTTASPAPDATTRTDPRYAPTPATSTTPPDDTGSITTPSTRHVLPAGGF